KRKRYLARRLKPRVPAKGCWRGRGRDQIRKRLPGRSGPPAWGITLRWSKSHTTTKPSIKLRVFSTTIEPAQKLSPFPIFLYSVPQFTGVSLETPEIVALSEHPNIIGMKDSSGIVQRTVEVLATASNFQMLTGSASVVFPSLSAGATGAILALGSAFPEKFVAVYHPFRPKIYDQARP